MGCEISMGKTQRCWVCKDKYIKIYGLIPLSKRQKGGKRQKQNFYCLRLIVICEKFYKGIVLSIWKFIKAHIKKKTA